MPASPPRRAIQSLLLLICFVMMAPTPAAAAPPSDGPDGRDRYLTGRLPLHEPRSRTVDVQHMDLALTVQPQQHAAHGVVTYTGVTRSAAPTLVLYATDLNVTEVVLTVAGAVIPGPHPVSKGQLRLVLRGASAGASFPVRLTWAVTRPAMGLYFVGPDRDEPKRPVHVWTQGEPRGARHWLPSPDDPDERMTWRVRVNVPKGLRVLSNGEAGPTTTKGGRHTAQYTLTKPYPLYLLTLAIGPFQAQRHPHKRVRIESWAFPQHQARIGAIGRRTGEMLDHFEQLTGTAYPHATYGHVYVDEFMAGGMENITLTTLTTRAIGTKRSDRDRTIDGLLAHELAHQWFGDLVTCRTWADLWLNEGFATFYQKLWTLQAHGINRFAEEMADARSAALAADATAPRPVVSDRYRHPMALFDGHAYRKGAWVLHMLREQLGHAVFDAGIKAYLQRHGHQSVETADLRRAMEHVSGQSLRGFFRRWLRQPGAAKVEAQIAWDARHKRLQVTLRQTQKIDGQRPAFELPVQVAYASGGKVMRHVMDLNARHERWSVQLPDAPAWVMVDPQMALLVGWKLRADADLMRGTARLAPHPDARLRAVLALRGALHRDVVVQTLLTVLRDDKARHVRAAAAKVLGAAPRATVRAGLQRAAQSDAESKVRGAAAAALGELRDHDSVDLLTRSARNDASDAVREASLRAVFVIDRAKARPLLLEATTWPTWRDRLTGAALLLLAKLADPRDLHQIWAATEVGRRKTVRGPAAAALATFAVRVRAARDPAREHLEAMLQEDSARLRAHAVTALKTLSLPASRTALLAAAGREPSFRMALRMRDAAKGLGSKLPVEERIRSLERSLRQLEERAKEGKADHNRAGHNRAHHTKTNHANAAGKTHAARDGAGTPKQPQRGAP